MGIKMDFQVKPMRTKSGFTEVAARTFKRFNGTSNKIWLVADQPNAADNIYVWSPCGEGGFGGSELSFVLTDGSILKLKGPWHSNSNSFLRDTGIDITDKHYTYGVISLEKEYPKNVGNFNDWNPLMKDVLYKDTQFTLGKFERIEKLAQEMANKLGKIVHYYSESMGGSSCGQKNPE